MSWLQLILQLLPDVIGIISQIEAALNATPATGTAVATHVANIKTTVHAASSPTPPAA